MVGKLKKLSTTFIQTTVPDSVVRLLKNRIQPNCLRFQTVQKLQIKIAIYLKAD